MDKLSALRPDVQLADHQEDAVRTAESNGGRLLLAHPVGSGKTPTYVAIGERLKERGMVHHPLVIAPAGLQENFVDTVHRFSDQHAAILSSNLSRIPRADYHVVSYDKFRKNPHGYLKATGADMLIIDELHKARTEGTKNLTSLDAASRDPQIKSVIAGTGSVANNHPHDIVPQINVVSGGNDGLGTTAAFDKIFTGVRKRHVGPLGWMGIGPEVEEPYLKNTHVLKPILKQYVHYLDKLPATDVPEKVVHDVPVEMSREQHKIYEWSIGQLDPMTRWKIRMNLPPTAREYSKILPKLTQQRQISNAIHPYSKQHDELASALNVPKTKAIIDDIESHLAEDPKHKAIVYSNFVRTGIHPIEAYLKHKGIPYGKFIGAGNEGVTPETRQEDIKGYLAGKHRVMLISGAGTEGLNLPGTTRHYTMDPHYNPEVLTQSEARGIRRGSPVPKVDVFRYRSYPKRNLMQKVTGKRDHGIDDWIYTMADDKDKFNKQLTDLLKTGSQGVRMNPYQSYMAKQASLYSNPANDPAVDLAAGAGGAAAGMIGGYAVGHALTEQHQARHQQALAAVDQQAQAAAHHEVGQHLGILAQQRDEAIQAHDQVAEALDKHYGDLQDLDEHYNARLEGLNHDYNSHASMRDEAWRLVNPQRQHKDGWVGSPGYQQKVMEHQYYTKQVARVQAAMDQVHAEAQNATAPFHQKIGELEPVLEQHRARIHQIVNSMAEEPRLLDAAYQRHAAALRDGVMAAARHYPAAGAAAGVALGTAAGLGGLALYRHMTRKPS